MDARAIFTPELIEAAVALVFMVLVGLVPELKTGLDSIRAGIVFILLTLIGSQTAHRVVERQEVTKVQIAVQQAQIQAAALENKYPPRN